MIKRIKTGALVLLAVFLTFGISNAEEIKDGTVTGNNIVFFSPSAATTVDYKNDLASYTKQFNNVMNANLSNDLSKAYKNSDYKFIAIAGYTYIIPGIQDGLENKYVKQFGFKVIAGTSDARQLGYPELDKAAGEYAEKYNKQLLNLLLNGKAPVSAPIASDQYSYKPNEGYVPDGNVAIKIAEAILSKIYGQNKIDQEKPLNVRLKDGIWEITGTLNCSGGGHNCLGGVAVIEISKDNGRILRVSHGK